MGLHFAHAALSSLLSTDICWPASLLWGHLPGVNWLSCPYAPAAELNAAHDWDLNIHVDAASGGQLRPSHVACVLLSLLWACFFHGLCLCAASMIPS